MSNSSQQYKVSLYASDNDFIHNDEVIIGLKFIQMIFLVITYLNQSWTDEIDNTGSLNMISDLDYDLHSAI